MYYVTVMQHRRPKQLTWEDMFNDNLDLKDFEVDNSNITATLTKRFDVIPQELLNKIDVDGMIRWLNKFNEDTAEIASCDRKSLYTFFKRLKKTGGYRDISAPCDELQDWLRRLSRFITNTCGILYHTSAFAYVKDRCIVDCVRKHQKFESKWFLKTDFSGFFPNTTIDFTMKMLSMIFPLSEVCKRQDGYDALKKALSLGFLDGGLPQGTCLSPTLTNCFMIPIDHKLFNTFASRHMVYTRYADDMHISAIEKFPMKEAVNIIKDTLKEFGAPWELKPEKTHYGSVNGKNWILGLMLNGRNDITVGYRNKRYFKAEINSFILDTINGNPWSLEDVNHLKGKIAYYTMIEKEYFESIIDRQNKKYKVNINELFSRYFNN